MIAPAKPEDEVARLLALRALNLLDSAPEERFDHVTRLAQRMFNVPTALVTLVDSQRVWVKSSQGFDGTEGSREASFCGHAILNHAIMSVPDTSMDARFVDNPFVLGDPNIRFYAGCPIAEPSGHLIGTLCLIDSKTRSMTAEDEANLRDLADIIEQEIASHNLASIDTLTGLSNRRGFELTAEKLLASFRRRGVPATLLYLDLDKFKSINDDFGHATGDEALIEFAQLLDLQLRESDMVARLGGDEFVALLAETESAETAISRIHQALRERNLSTAKPYGLDVSIGSSVFDPSGTDSLELLLGRADASMYRKKNR